MPDLLFSLLVGASVISAMNLALAALIWIRQMAPSLWPDEELSEVSPTPHVTDHDEQQERLK